jgi:hypothetical protein
MSSKSCWNTIHIMSYKHLYTVLCCVLYRLFRYFLRVCFFIVSKLTFALKASINSTTSSNFMGVYKCCTNIFSTVFSACIYIYIYCSCMVAMMNDDHCYLFLCCSASSAQNCCTVCLFVGWCCCCHCLLLMCVSLPTDQLYTVFILSCLAHS